VKDEGLIEYNLTLAAVNPLSFTNKLAPMRGKLKWSSNIISVRGVVNLIKAIGTVRLAQNIDGRYRP